MYFGWYSVWFWSDFPLVFFFECCLFVVVWLWLIVFVVVGGIMGFKKRWVRVLVVGSPESGKDKIVHYFSKKKEIWGGEFAEAMSSLPSSPSSTPSTPSPTFAPSPSSPVNVSPLLSSPSSPPSSPSCQSCQVVFEFETKSVGGEGEGKKRKKKVYAQISESPSEFTSSFFDDVHIILFLYDFNSPSSYSYLSTLFTEHPFLSSSNGPTKFIKALIGHSSSSDFLPTSPTSPTSPSSPSSPSSPPPPSSPLSMSPGKKSNDDPTSPSSPSPSPSPCPPPSPLNHCAPFHSHPLSHTPSLSRFPSPPPHSKAILRCTSDATFFANDTAMKQKGKQLAERVKIDFFSLTTKPFKQIKRLLSSLVYQTLSTFPSSLSSSSSMTSSRLSLPPSLPPNHPYNRYMNGVNFSPIAVEEEGKGKEKKREEEGKRGEKKGDVGEEEGEKRKGNFLAKLLPKRGKKIPPSEYFFRAKKGDLEWLSDNFSQEMLHGVNEKGSTLLMEATENDREDVVDFLLKSGADPNLANEKGYTPLHLAALNTNPTTVSSLLSSGGDPSRHTLDWETTPLHNLTSKTASSVNHELVFQNLSLFSLILQKFPDLVNAVNVRGETAVHCAALFHSLQVLTILTKLGRVDFSLKTKKGEDLLMCAVKDFTQPSAHLVSYLLKIPNARLELTGAITFLEEKKQQQAERRRKRREKSGSELQDKKEQNDSTSDDKNNNQPKDEFDIFLTNINDSLSLLKSFDSSCLASSLPPSPSPSPSSSPSHFDLMSKIIPTTSKIFEIHPCQQKDPTGPRFSAGYLFLCSDGIGLVLNEDPLYYPPTEFTLYWSTTLHNDSRIDIRYKRDNELKMLILTSFLDVHQIYQHCHTLLTSNISPRSFSPPTSFSRISSRISSRRSSSPRSSSPRVYTPRSSPGPFALRPLSRECSPRTFSPPFSPSPPSSPVNHPRSPRGQSPPPLPLSSPRSSSPPLFNPPSPPLYPSPPSSPVNRPRSPQGQSPPPLVSSPHSPSPYCFALFKKFYQKFEEEKKSNPQIECTLGFPLSDCPFSFSSSTTSNSLIVNVAWDQIILDDQALLENEWENFGVEFPKKFTPSLVSPHLPLDLSAVSPSSFSTLSRWGVPIRFRSDFWYEMSGGKAKQEASSPEYWELLSNKARKIMAVKVTKDRVQNQIRLDVERTLPTHPLFCEGEGGGGKEALLFLLTMYSLRDPELGYLQGINGIASLLLLTHKGDVQRTFWTLTGLLEHLFPDYFSQMGEILFDGELIHELFSVGLVDLCEWWGEEEGDEVQWLGLLQPATIFKWFFTLFTYETMRPPTPTLLWIWDNLFTNGRSFLFFVALALFRLCKPQLLTLRENELILKEITTAITSQSDPLKFAGYVHSTQDHFFSKNMTVTALRSVRYFSKFPTKFRENLPEDVPGLKLGVEGGGGEEHVLVSLFQKYGSNVGEEMKVSFLSFQQMIVVLQSSMENSSPFQEEQLQKIFKIIDVEKKGQISLFQFLLGLGLCVVTSDSLKNHLKFLYEELKYGHTRLIWGFANKNSWGVLEEIIRVLSSIVYGAAAYLDGNTTIFPTKKEKKTKPTLSFWNHTPFFLSTLSHSSFSLDLPFPFSPPPLPPKSSFMLHPPPSTPLSLHIPSSARSSTTPRSSSLFSKASSLSSLSSFSFSKMTPRPPPPSSTSTPQSSFPSAVSFSSPSPSSPPSSPSFSPPPLDLFAYSLKFPTFDEFVGCLSLFPHLLYHFNYCVEKK